MMISWYNSDKYTPDTVIWRYMDIMKFLDLIQTKQLYFSNIESFNDPYEGFISPVYKTYELGQINGDGSKYKYVLEQRKKLKNYFINCWHVSEYENVAMWKLYADKNNGIAIKSTINNLMVSIGNANYKDKEYKKSISFGKVKYLGEIDENEFSKIKNNRLFGDITRILFYKNISFEAEKEIRIVIKKENNEHNYCKIKIDLNALLNEIYIIPTAPAYYNEVIKNIIEKYNIKNNKGEYVPINKTDIFK